MYQNRFRRFCVSKFKLYLTALDLCKKAFIKVTAISILSRSYYGKRDILETWDQACALAEDCSGPLPSVTASIQWGNAISTLNYGLNRNIHILGGEFASTCNKSIL